MGFLPLQPFVNQGGQRVVRWARLLLVWVFIISASTFGSVMAGYAFTGDWRYGAFIGLALGVAFAAGLSARGFSVPVGELPPDHPQADSMLFQGGQARNIAARMALLATVVCFTLSFWMSWPLGPDYVDEGGITRIRLAIAMLVIGQALSLGSLIFYVQDILVQIKQLTKGASKPRERDSEV